MFEFRDSVGLFLFVFFTFGYSDYNNIYLGKRIFGPARKQVFKSTIIGGAERRFEIIENQVNHIPFTHEASDSCPEKCRNRREFF